MKADRLIVRLLIAILAIAMLASCTPAATPAPTVAPQQPTDAPKAAAPTSVPVAAQPTVAPAAPTSVPVAAQPTVAPAAPAASGTLDKIQFRLNWTYYGEHTGFIVARDMGFYKDEGLNVEIMEGSGSTTVLQLAANKTNPIAYVDAATMIRGVAAGMPVEAVAVMLQQSPMAFIYRADAAKPTKLSEIKGSKIAITAGDASLAIFTAFMGKAGMKVEDVHMITVATAASKEQAVLSGQADALLGYFMDQGPRMQLQSGVKMGWTRLYDLNGTTTLSSAIVVNTDWLKDAKNQDILRRFLRASQRGWQWTQDNPSQAADLFIKTATAFNTDIAMLEIKGTMSIVRSKAAEGKPLGWSAASDWKDSQDLLATYAGLSPVAPDVNVYFTNDYLSEVPYLPKK
jgi:NitT/TauT family transport system substrate-binding protein